MHGWQSPADCRECEDMLHIFLSLAQKHVSTASAAHVSPVKGLCTPDAHAAQTVYRMRQRVCMEGCDTRCHHPAHRMHTELKDPWVITRVVPDAHALTQRPLSLTLLLPCEARQVLCDRNLPTWVHNLCVVKVYGWDPAQQRGAAAMLLVRSTSRGLQLWHFPARQCNNSRVDPQNPMHWHFYNS